jgi:hypothetical protein
LRAGKFNILVCITCIENWIGIGLHPFQGPMAIGIRTSLEFFVIY